MQPGAGRGMRSEQLPGKHDVTPRAEAGLTDDEQLAGRQLGETRNQRIAVNVCVVTVRGVFAFSCSSSTEQKFVCKGGSRG